MEIFISEIEDAVSTTNFNRGMEYYLNCKVIKAIEQNNGRFSTNFIGIVKGSGHNIYTQDIKITNSLYAGIDISGYCNCPVGFNCKHVIAVCIKAIEKKEPTKQTNVIDKWLGELSETSKHNSSVKIIQKNDDYFLTYRFFSSTTHKNDELLFYKSKQLKSGQINQGTLLNSDNLFNGSYANLRSSNDNMMINLYYTITSTDGYGGRKRTIKSELGYILIQKLIASSKCYYDLNKEPLIISEETIKPAFNFILEKGKYIIKSDLLESRYKILDSTPALIIDTIENSVKQFSIEANVYKKILSVPKINKKDIGKVFTTIGQTIPQVKLETPEAIKTKNIDKKPIPQLHLQYTNDKENKTYTSFKVNFKYGNYIVKYHPVDKIQSFYDKSLKIDIHRDLDFENECFNKIIQYGFSIEVINDDIVVELKQTNKQAQLTLWKEFLNIHIKTLEKEKWNIIYDELFDMKFESNSEVVVNSDDKNDWFSLSFDLEFNGISQPIAPLVSGIIEEFNNFDDMPLTVNIEVNENHFVEVQTKQLKPIINTIIELMDKKEKDNTIKVSPFDAHLIDNLDDDIKWIGNKKILELSKKLKNFKGIDKINTSKCFTATLRDYQQEGLNWLNFLYEFNFGGILADDMGLGKTIQTLAHLSKLKEDGKLNKPSLIVMPTSLIANWKNEANKFTPNLSVLPLQGSDRFNKFDDIKTHDIILTTYPLIVKDKAIFDKYTFCYIILDEAQKIKNPKTKMTMSIKTFKCEYRLALSGTPIENHLGELWSIFSFLMPGFLDTLTFFKNYYQTPIEKENNILRQKLLNKRVKPFMIRRTKELVAHELPKKSIIVKYTQFDNKQSKLYESIRVTMEKRVREAVSKKGIGSSHITILDALLKLRQVCCDPSLLKIAEAKKVQDSAKLDLLLDLLDELVAENRKILLFSQFTSMLSIIEEAIIKRKISFTKLTGSTKNRPEAIEAFTKGDAQIFLISLKAGGVGLNLVEADTVIHYDPWWNPAVENQATDRAYRIGQKKAVFVYKLIVENTIEQKILELQKKKQQLQDGIYDENKQQDDIKFSGNELMDLLK